MNEKHPGNIRLHAHTVKGMALNISAHRAAEAASRIELIGKKCGTDIIHTLKKLEQECEALESVLSELFPDVFQTVRPTPQCY